jgi:hypothetical protein
LEDINLDIVFGWLLIFDVLPLWSIAVIFFVAMMIALEIAFHVGRLRRHTWRDPEKGGGAIVQTSLFAVLGLVLAFTYSASLNKYETRKAALVNEANAIGTAFYRADLAVEPGRQELMQSLYDYALTRSVPPRSLHTPEDFQNLLSRTLEKQSRIWPATKQVIGQDNPLPLETAIVTAVNHVMDAHTFRLAAVIDRLQPTIIWLLLLVAASAMAVAGYTAGIQDRISRWRMAAFSIVLTALAMSILDLDRPNDGTVIVDQRIMDIVIADMHKMLYQN